MNSRGKKKLLVAGGGYADIPMIMAAQGLGYHVITSGNRPQDLGHQRSDECRLADFSDREAMLALAEDLEVDAICPSCNDFSAISCAYVAEKMRLPGHDSLENSLTLHHKDRYRNFAQQNDIRTPLARGFSAPSKAKSTKNDWNYPVIVKPVDLTGGKGISKVARSKEFDSSVDQAFAISRISRIVIEEFLEGSRHGFSAFIREGKVVFHFTDDEYYFNNPYLVSGASAPTSVSVSVVNELVTQSERIAELLKLRTGIFHVQFILHEEKPVIIEICRRPPGDLYVKLVELATGVDYPEWIVRAFTGDPCLDVAQSPVRGNYLRHCIMTDREGVIESIEIEPSIRKKIVDELYFWSTGDQVDNSLVAKFGIVFLQFDSKTRMIEASNEMQNLIRAHMR